MKLLLLLLLLSLLLLVLMKKASITILFELFFCRQITILALCIQCIPG